MKMRLSLICYLIQFFALSAIAQNLSPGFYVIEGAYTWAQAQADAVKRGGNLAVVTTAEQQGTIELLFSKKSGSYWLGGTDAVVEGQWKWVTDEPFSFSKWSLGEPNNANNEDGITLVANNGCKWNDAPLTWNLGYLLEIKPQGFPGIKSHPQSQTVTVGNNVTFCVSTKEAGSYNYQWQANGKDIVGANLNCYTINSISASENNARYRVFVSNSSGNLVSETATLSVITPPPPQILTQPIGANIKEESNFVLSVIASGEGVISYQWQFNEQNIIGATTATMSIESITPSQTGRYRVVVTSPYGVTIGESVSVVVTPNPPPTINIQPTSKTVQEGENTGFSVTASGLGNISYQWQLNEQNLPGATSQILSLNGIRLNSGGRYRVLVISKYGVTISNVATLTVNPNPPPTITAQPTNKTAPEGVAVTLNVAANGEGLLLYQWQKNGENIAGAISPNLVLSATRPSSSGTYRVIVSSPYGTTISTEVTVSVIVTDSDSDGLSDYEELLLGTNANKSDSDGDGLSDFAEVRTHKSNPLTTDTDGDGYSDGIEVARDGNPNNRSVTPTGALAVFPAVDVEFYTLNSVKYQLEVSTDMVSWSAQGGVVVGNGGSQNHLVRASKATQFWRLKVVQ